MERAFSFTAEKQNSLLSFKSTPVFLIIDAQATSVGDARVGWPLHLPLFVSLRFCISASFQNSRT